MSGGARWRRAALAAFFGLFVLFLYGPTATIFVLSFQGPEGGLTFPLRGAPSGAWFRSLFTRQAVGDLGGAFGRSVALALLFAAVTVPVSVAAGLAFRRRFPGAGPLLALTVSSLIVPSILVSLGIGLLFSQLDLDPAWWSSALGAQLTWTLPFGVLIMLAVLNRFDRSWEEAARDAGASPWQGFRHVLLPIVLPSVVGVGQLGLTQSKDDLAPTQQAAGSDNTLPLEIFGMTTNVTTPVLYALGTLTTLGSFLVIGGALAAMALLARRRVRRTA